MFGFKISIFGLFIWLSFAVPIQNIGFSSIDDTPSEIYDSSNSIHHQALIVDNYVKTQHTNGSFKTFKVSFNHFNTSRQVSIAQSYNHKLAYFEIGKSIPLKLTAKTIIFPFHFFT